MPLSMEGKMPYLVVILVQAIYGGMFLLTKVAMNHGLSSFVFVFYRQVVATIVLVSVAIVFKGKEAFKVSPSVFVKIFMLSLFGITGTLNLYGVGIRYTTSTLGAATFNTLPAMTFLLAVLLRMEVVKVKSLNGIAKVVGIVVCLGGAMTYAFYKGPRLLSLGQHNSKGSHHSSETWITGSFLLLVGNIFWSLWTVLQGRVLKEYPSKLLFTAMQCFLSTIQSFFVAIAFEHNSARWKLGLDVGLLSIAYCGIVVTSITFYLQAWVIEKKGPVFLAMFTPLSLVTNIILSMFLLGEVITVGSVCGVVLLVGGLYIVLWCKNKEEGSSETHQQRHDSKEEMIVLESIATEVK
ncbi:WAT1-related protein At5g64700-like [Tasmannia lanceolata]|uniref:WAT1-related protein At5g64700-like n=1 Tax=Tasmannia lanceolata TaxID=3420 RepID=UPI004062D575